MYKLRNTTLVAYEVILNKNGTHDNLTVTLDTRNDTKKSLRRQ